MPRIGKLVLPDTPAGIGLGNRLAEIFGFPLLMEELLLRPDLLQYQTQETTPGQKHSHRPEAGGAGGGGGTGLPGGGG